MRYKILSFICFLVVNQSISQQFEQSSLYMFNALNYNPAYAGSREGTSISLLTRKQWVGIDGAPSTSMFSMHSPLLNRKIGLGVHLTHDVIGSRTKTNINLDLTSSIRLNKKGDRLNVGLTAGYENSSLNFSNLYTIDPNDIIANSNYSLASTPIGFGAYYFGEKHYIGLSIPNVLEGATNKRHFILTAGKVFKINSTTDFKPSVLMKYVAGAPIIMDANVSFLFYKKLWLGGLYRLNEGGGINVAFIFNNKFTLGYSYDFPFSSYLLNRQSGSHEIVLQFDIKSASSKLIYSPRYF
jgi:type IX secretion system PorP/SprF family membrane protein